VDNLDGWNAGRDRVHRSVTPNDEGDKVVDTFSADGKEVYYEKSLGRDEVWAVATLGGTPRRVASASLIVTSPDGASIFYAKNGRRGIFRAGKSGLNEESVYNPEGAGLAFIPLLLFPDGNDILSAASSNFWEQQFHFYRINPTSHEAIDLGEVSGNAADVVWGEPGKTVLFSRNVDGLTNIWKYSLKDRSLMQITFGAGSDEEPMPDPGGKGIYFVNGRSSGVLTAYHVHSKESTDIVSEKATQPIISPDGRRVMYIALPAKDRNELWVSNIDGSNKVKLATGEALWTGDWAPDDFHLSFCETGASTGAKTYIVAADGSGLHQLPFTGVGPMNSVWSPNQKSIYASGGEIAGATRTIWKANVDGTSQEKFVDDCGYVNDADPGGQYLLSAVFEGEKTGIYEVSTSDRKCTLLLPGVIQFGGVFARDGKSFMYAVAFRGQVTIYRQLWRDGKLIGSPQVALKVPFAFSLAYGTNASDFSRDLSTIVYERPSGNADLYLLSKK
jgi:hypothetical protein